MSKCKSIRISQAWKDKFLKVWVFFWNSWTLRSLTKLNNTLVRSFYQLWIHTNSFTASGLCKIISAELQCISIMIEHRWDLLICCNRFRTRAAVWHWASCLPSYSCFKHRDNTYQEVSSLIAFYLLSKNHHHQSINHTTKPQKFGVIL